MGTRDDVVLVNTNETRRRHSITHKDQHVLYCAEEKKIQSLLVNNNNHAAASMQHTISGIDRSAAALQGSQLGSRFTQNDTALVDAIRAGTSQVGEYPPAFFEKKLRGGESDEHVKLLLEVARQERALSLGLQGSVP